MGSITSTHNHGTKNAEEDEIQEAPRAPLRFKSAYILFSIASIDST
jgi:hypothetical protein